MSARFRVDSCEWMRWDRWGGVKTSGWDDRIMPGEEDEEEEEEKVSKQERRCSNRRA